MLFTLTYEMCMHNAFIVEYYKSTTVLPADSWFSKEVDVSEWYASILI